ncbi:DinB family protein [Candidatus Bipolaricaulota bacterium]
MSEEHLEVFLHALDIKRDQWFGGPSAAGSLRNVSNDLALWRPDGTKHCIWGLALHVAYWEYAVRRMLENGPKGKFPRKPSNWPATPEKPSEEAWKADRKLVKQQRDALVEAVRSFDATLLRKFVPSSSKYTYSEVLIGIAQHSVYHTGQITLLKRMGKRKLEI